MERDSVAALVKDLTARLSDVADEFARRAEQVAALSSPAPPSAKNAVGDASDAALVGTA